MHQVWATPPLCAKFRGPLTFLSNLRCDGPVWGRAKPEELATGLTGDDPGGLKITPEELATGLTGDDPGGFKITGDVEVNGAVAATAATCGFRGTPTPNLGAPFKLWNSDIPLTTV